MFQNHEAFSVSINTHEYKNLYIHGHVCLYTQTQIYQGVVTSIEVVYAPGAGIKM